MGFEALFGVCEHCKSKYRRSGKKASKDTEVVDIFIPGPDNSINGIHKKLGFLFFEYRTRICKTCLERYENTDELFKKLNSNLQVNKILIVYLERGKNQYKILSRKNKAARE